MLYLRIALIVAIVLNYAHQKTRIQRK